MNEITVVEDSKKLLKKIAYNIRYGRKFKKFNIDKSFSDTLIDRSKDSDEREIFHLINKSKNQVCITVIGIPFGLQHFKLAKLALMPFGADVI